MPSPVYAEFTNSQGETVQHNLPTHEEIAKLLRSKTATQADFDMLMFGWVIPGHERLLLSRAFYAKGVDPDTLSDDEIFELHTQMLKKEMLMSIASSVVEKHLKEQSFISMTIDNLKDFWRKRSKLFRVICFLNICWGVILVGLALWKGADLWGGVYGYWNKWATENFLWTLLFPLFMLDVGAYCYQRFIK